MRLRVRVKDLHFFESWRKKKNGRQWLDLQLAGAGKTMRGNYGRLGAGFANWFDFFFTILSFIVVSWWRTLYVNWLHYSTHCGTRQQTSSH